MPGLPNRITTSRLVLRAWDESDAEELNAAIESSLEHLLPWMPWAVHEPMTLDRRLELIRGWRADHDADGDAVYGAFLDDRIIGGCGLHRRGGPGTLEVGYWVHADHVRPSLGEESGRGLA